MNDNAFYHSSNQWVLGGALFKGYNKSRIAADMDLGRTPVHLHVLAPLQTGSGNSGCEDCAHLSRIQVGIGVSTIQ